MIWSSTSEHSLPVRISSLRTDLEKFSWHAGQLVTGDGVKDYTGKAQRYLLHQTQYIGPQRLQEFWKSSTK